MAGLQPCDESKDFVGRTSLETTRTAISAVGREVHGSRFDSAALLGVVENLVLRHRQDAPGADFHRNGRRTQFGSVNVVRHSPRLILRCHLECVVHRCVQLVPADVPVRQALFRGFTERFEVGDVLHDIVTEPSGIGVCRDASAQRGFECHKVFVHRSFHRLGELRLADVSLVVHRLKDDISSCLVLGVKLGVGKVSRFGVLHNGDERGRLGKGHVFRGLAEIHLGRRFNSVVVSAKVGDVEVGEKNLFLRVALL